MRWFLVLWIRNDLVRIQTFF